MIRDHEALDLAHQCQVGFGGKDALERAHECLAECYGTLHRLTADRAVLRDALKALSEARPFADPAAWDLARARAIQALCAVES